MTREQEVQWEKQGYFIDEKGYILTRSESVQSKLLRCDALLDL